MVGQWKLDRYKWRNFAKCVLVLLLRVIFVIPTVIGTLGTVSDDIEEKLEQIEIVLFGPCLQKASFFGTVFILKRVLGISKSR